MTEVQVPIRLRSLGLGALIAVCLYVSGLLVILTPLPLVYVSATYGRKNGLLSSALAFILVAALYIGFFIFTQASGTTPDFVIPLPGLGLVSHFSKWGVNLFGLGYFLFFVIVAMVLGEAVRRHWGLVKGGTSALMAGLLLTLFIGLLLEFSGAAQLVSSVRGYLEFVVSEIARLQETAGGTTAQTQFLLDHGHEVAAFVFNVIPALIFVFALVAVVVNLLFSRRFIRMPHLFSGHSWDVAAFRVSDLIIWGVIVAAAAFFAGRYLTNMMWLEYIGINTLIALGAIYFFQGLAVTAYFLRRLKIPLLRIAAYILIILFFQSIGILIIGIGLADIWVDFRRRAHRVHA
jgi:hypothetical protein